MMCSDHGLTRSGDVNRGGGAYVRDLRTEGGSGHIVTDVARPRLTWVVTGALDDATVHVQARRHGGTRAAASGVRADWPAWDWATQAPVDRLGAVYGGPRPALGQMVQWRARVCSAGAHSVWSSPATFEAGLGCEMWSASWACADPTIATAPLLRCGIDVPGGVVRATLAVCGLGYGLASIDGAVIGDSRLGPPFTDVRHTVLYETFDVTDRLPAGPHVVGMALGRGFFAMDTVNVWGWHEAPWHAAPSLIAQIMLTMQDGSRMLLGPTPGRWTCAAGGTLADSLYEGEIFDARRVPTGWDTPAYDATAWAPVVPSQGPSGTVLACDVEPIRVIESVPPRRMEDRAGVRLVDFGRTTAGWVRLAGRLEAGQQVGLTHGEALDEQGRVEAVNEHVTTDRFQTDEVIGDGLPMDWEPSFSYKGFRYVEVEGLTAGQECELTMQVAHTDVARSAWFSCDVELFERYDAAMRRSLLSNLHGLPTDTPMYEKNGWTGDAQVAARVMSTTLDLRRLLPKWLRDMADAQWPDGRLPVIVPSSGWGYQDRLAAPEWTTAYPHLLREAYRCYGDERVVQRHWHGVARYLDWEWGRLVDGLASTGLGDYLAPGTTGLPPEDRRLTATAYLARALTETAQLAPLAGAESRGRALTGRAHWLTDRLNAVFLDRDTGEYRVGADYRQTANAVPLAFGLVPEDLRSRVCARLVQDVRARSWHLNTGNLGTQLLLPVLTRHGYAEDAFRVASQRTYPGWGAWLEQGADTMWEFWQSPGRSRNHYFQGTVVQWLHEDVVGLRVGDQGWAWFTVRPHARHGVRRARLALDTVRGHVAAGWEEVGARLVVEVTVPVGSRATVELPVGQGARLRTPPGVACGAVTEGWASCAVGPGSWSFVVERG